MAENNQSTSVSVQNGNSFAYMDQLISLRIFKTIENLMNNLNIKSVVLLIGLLGADSFKKVITLFIEKCFSKLTNANVKMIIYNIMNIYNKPPKLIEPQPVNTLSLKYTPKKIFWEGLDKIIKSETDIVSYNIVSTQIEQISKVEYHLYETVNNFKIKNNNWSCHANDTMTLEYMCIGNDKKLQNSCNKKIVFDKTKTLFENLPFKNFIKDCTKASIYKKADGFSTSGFKHNIIYNYKKYNNISIAPELACILFAGRNTNLFCPEKQITLFDIDFPVDAFMKADIVYNWENIRDADLVKEWVDNQIKNNNNDTLSLNLYMKSDNLELDLLNSWTQFVDGFQKDIIQINNTTIKVYDIKLIEKKSLENIPNPDYDENDKDTKDKDNKIPKFLQQTNITKEINENLINEIYKDFSTLYLKQQDSFHLNSTLDRFKNNKHIYKNLGLSYKFGALLYGPPGTGKSSCINAIASYLKKDIYYLDLTTVKTNDDLKLIFNHINKEKSETGIIVIEDIDAMTTIVHDRKFNENTNSELTLECLLNLLQGTLTHDGTTFLVTTNHLEKLDPAFYRDGRFDIKLALTPCDHYQMNTIYNKFFERDIPQYIIQKIPEIEITPATFIQQLLPYILKPDTLDTDILTQMIS